jgi:hypothetical protein
MSKPFNPAAYTGGATQPPAKKPYENKPSYTKAKAPSSYNKGGTAPKSDKHIQLRVWVDNAGRPRYQGSFTQIGKAFVAEHGIENVKMDIMLYDNFLQTVLSTGNGFNEQIVGGGYFKVKKGAQ